MGWYEDRIFPHLLDWATKPLQRQRQEIIASAEGRVLELGVGTGANLAFYGESASEVHGIEPAAALLDIARERAARLSDPARFRFEVAGAEALPYPDQHFDTVIACLVFCTIPDTTSAARELWRVMKPGGRLLLLEHVASQKPAIHRTQRLLNPAWRKLACGCQLTRDTASLLSDAGFNMGDVSHWRHPKVPAFAAELISGVAIRP